MAERFVKPDRATHKYLNQNGEWVYCYANGKIDISIAFDINVSYIWVKNGDKWENNDYHRKNI